MKEEDIFDRNFLFESMSKAALFLAWLALLPSPGQAFLHSISLFSLRTAGFSSRTGRAPKIYPLSACFAPEENLASIPRRQAIFGIALAGTLTLVQPACAADALDELKAARKLLNKIDGYIAKAEWDKCRTALNNPPLGFAGQNSIKGNIEKVGGGKSVFKGLAQDALTGQRLLDSFCYSNVFVDESRQVLGLKIDYNTPKMYLLDTKTALDQIIELAAEE